MCNHYRQAILKGEKIPGWSIDQFSEIKVPLRFHSMPADVYPDREGLVIHLQNGNPILDAMRWSFPSPPNAGAYYVTNVRDTKSAFWKPWLKVVARTKTRLCRSHSTPLPGQSRDHVAEHRMPDRQFELVPGGPVADTLPSPRETAYRTTVRTKHPIALLGSALGQLPQPLEFLLTCLAPKVPQLTGFVSNIVPVRSSRDVSRRRGGRRLRVSSEADLQTNPGLMAFVIAKAALIPCC